MMQALGTVSLFLGLFPCTEALQQSSDPFILFHSTGEISHMSSFCVQLHRKPAEVNESGADGLHPGSCMT